MKSVVVRDKMFMKKWLQNDFLCQFNTEALLLKWLYFINLPPPQNCWRVNSENIDYIFCTIQLHIALNSTYFLISFISNWCSYMIKLYLSQVILIEFAVIRKGKFRGLINYENTFACLLGSYFIHCPQAHLQRSFNGQCLFLCVFDSEYKLVPREVKGWQGSRTTLRKLVFPLETILFSVQFQVRKTGLKTNPNRS